MRRALLVSYYFPPRFSIGGKRAHRFARYLPEHGWSTTVLTARGASSERLDPSFSDGELPACDVRRDYLTEAEVAALPKSELGSDGTIEAPTKAWAPMPRSGLGRVRAELRFRPPVGPDARRIPLLATRIARLAREVGAEVVFATGSPWEAVVAGTLAGRALGVPVVVDFRDPWSFGPLMRRKPAWLQATDALVERAVLRAAAALTVTTESTRERYASLGASRRVECIRNGFDPAIVPSKLRDGAVTLIHFGNCYGERNLAPFLRALAAVVARRKLGPEEVRLVNLGRVAEEDLALARSLRVERHFSFRAVLPYKEGIDRVAGADLALLPSFGDEPWFLPGKLYDYLLARTPILGASSSRELARILASTRLGWTYPPGENDPLERRIEEAIDARAAGRPLVVPDDAAIDALSAQRAAGQLARLFDDVTGSASA